VIVKIKHGKPLVTNPERHSLTHSALGRRAATEAPNYVT